MADDQGNESQIVNELIGVGSEITGNVAGATIGFLLAGPPGAVAGAAATPVITRVVRVAADFAKRHLSRREEVRIGATITYAAAKIQENLTKGREPRTDGFLQSQPGERSGVEEILEGVLLSVQRDHEERKLLFYGNLLGNIPFRSDINRYQANYLIRLAQQLSFRQLCHISLFTRIKLNNANPQSWHTFRQMPEKDIVQELYSLSQLGIIARIVLASNVQLIEDSTLGEIRIDTLGEILNDLMELQTINDADMYTVLAPLLNFQVRGLGTSRPKWEEDFVEVRNEENDLVVYTSRLRQDELYYVRFVNNHVSYIETEYTAGTFFGDGIPVQIDEIKEIAWPVDLLIPLDARVVQVEQPSSRRMVAFYLSDFLSTQFAESKERTEARWANYKPGSFIIIQDTLYGQYQSGNGIVVDKTVKTTISAFELPGQANLIRSAS